MTTPARYGQGLGPFIPLAPQDLPEVSFADSGVDLSKGPADIDPGAATNAIDVRLRDGGINTDWAYTQFGSAYAGAEDKTVMRIGHFENNSGQQFIIRMRPTGWDRWDGSNWLTLSGALTGTPADKVSSTVYKGLFIGANLIDRLKSWDGNDAHAVQDLSADAPIAKFVMRLGGHLVAAYIKNGATIDPYEVAWSDFDNPTLWTPGTGNSAGNVDPPVEGADDSPQFITGLSALARGGVIYRQRAIQMMLPTGIGASPFRFVTVDFSHGTESPYSIAHGGQKLGDFYLGHDYMPYLFDGNSEPIPIGFPIHNVLQSSIPDRRMVIGGIDINQQEYYLGYPALGSVGIFEAWAFSIREYVRSNRLVWRRRSLPANTSAFGFGQLSVLNDPLVDSVSSIVNTVNERVNDFANQTGPDRLIFGDTDGQLWQTDRSTPSPNGSFTSKQFLFGDGYAMIDRLRLWVTATSAATIAVSVSVDGGLSFTAEKIYSTGATPSGAAQMLTQSFRVRGRSVVVRIRPLTGFCNITKMMIRVLNQGRGND